MQVFGLNGKGHLFALFGTFLLKRCCSPQCGIEGKIARLPVGGFGLDIAAPFALSPRAGSPSGVAARHFVERGIEFAWVKGLGGLNLLSPFPPVGIPGVEDILRAGFNRPALRRFFTGFGVYRFFFTWF